MTFCTPLKKFNSTESKPGFSLRGILSEAHVLKELIGDAVLLLYETEHRVALSLESLGQAADKDHGIAFSSVLWQSIQHSHGTRCIGQDPGHRLSIGTQHAAGREVCNHVADHP